MPILVAKLTKYLPECAPVYLSINKKNIRARMIEMIKGRTFSFIRIPKYIPSNLKSNFQYKYRSCTQEIGRWLYNSKSIVTINGVYLYDFLMKIIEQDLEYEMLDLYGEIISLKRLINVVKPKSAFAPHSLGVNYALGEICFKENIPALLITHGSHTPQTNTLPAYEWSVHAHTIINSMYPYVALQTPWTKKFLDNQNNVISKGISTGPLLFARPNYDNDAKYTIRKDLFGEENANHRILLHAGSARTWKSFRPWIYETVDEYIYNINSIIQALESLSGLYLAIRFRPLEGMSIQDFKRSLQKSACYGIYTEGTFDEYLFSSDLLVSYSSTTIEEALQNNIPVLQYDPDRKYEHIQGQLLSKKSLNRLSTVYTVHSENDLIPALGWWQEHHLTNINKKLDWSSHRFNNMKNMNWLKTMGIV